MTLLLSRVALEARRTALQDPVALGGLVGSLQRELHAALDVPVPDGKSRLTRIGGRCASCTVLLTFDPRQPHAHSCPKCGTVYTDRAHHEWWLMNGHLWTAEQCTRAASLAFVVDDHVAGQRADDILATYAARYLDWPNRDNALGPTRPFFSTYLESIWLLHLCVALDLREVAAGNAMRSLGGVVREQLVEPSARLIASFDEGRSNREVWHCAARLAAATLLDDTAMRDRAAESLRTLLRTGLHTDGSWYEGENYHLFAHRGLLTTVTLAERAGVELASELVRRFDAGFAAPFRTVLPDGTIPARRDSQYGISLRQYRTADWLECGIARHDTPELRAALATMYSLEALSGDTGRACSTADAERNLPGVRLTRADCSWRALLLARLDLPPLHDAIAHSELLEGQGLAVFRRDRGQFWLGLDYGDPGDGHGHPDRLNLVIATRDARLLDDVGTGSYTSPTLRWYRSSMAHNAPMVNGNDQGAAAGRLRAYDERDDIGWASAEFIDPVSGVRFVRSVLVLTDVVVDDLEWTSDRDVFVDLPMQTTVDVTHDVEWQPFTPGTTQDDMLHDVRMRTVVANARHAMRLGRRPSPAAELEAPTSDSFDCVLWTDTDAQLWTASTIGPPAGQPWGVTSLRQHGQRGGSRRLFDWAGRVTDVVSDSCLGSLRIATSDATRWECLRTGEGWTIGRTLQDTLTVARLVGQQAAPKPGPPVTSHPPTPVAVAVDPFTSRVLEAAHYRGTEATWLDAGQPRVEVGVSSSRHPDPHLVITACVSLGREPHFAHRLAENPLDNELPDVNSDGVQLHWRSGVAGAWNSVIAVPDGVAVRMTVASGSDDGLTARWTARPGGYDLCFVLPWPDHWPAFAFDLCVNEMPAGRERRRGQLVLSGANGESAYLRGARQGPDRAVTILFQHPTS